MSERERWIVYPLLFLALGAALRDKLTDRTTVKRIVCQELLIVDEESTGRDEHYLARIGRLKTNSSDGPPLGHFVIDGQIEAQAVSAQNYIFQNAPFGPAIRAMLPAMSIDPAEALRALERAAHAGTAPTTTPQSPASDDHPPPAAAPSTQQKTSPAETPKE